MAFPSAFFFFNDRGQGWTERYWWFDKNATLELVAGGALLLLQRRVKLLGSGVELPWAYVSMNDSFRDVLPVLPLPTADITTGNWNSAITGKFRYEPNVTLVIRCFSAANRAGKFTYLSGITVDSMTYPPLYNPKPLFSGGFTSALNSFLNELAGGRWGWKATTFGGTSVALSNITISGNAFLVTAPAAGIVKGQRVAVTEVVYTGVLSGQKVNSTYVCTDVAAGPIYTLDWGGRDFTGFVYQGGGRISGGQTEIQVIVAATADKIGTRKRGVGFGRQAGRRKGRK